MYGCHYLPGQEQSIESRLDSLNSGHISRFYCYLTDDPSSLNWPTLAVNDVAPASTKSSCNLGSCFETWRTKFCSFNSNWEPSRRSGYHVSELRGSRRKEQPEWIFRYRIHGELGQASGIPSTSDDYPSHYPSNTFPSAAKPRHK